MNNETAWKLVNVTMDRAPNGTDGRVQDRVEIELLSEGNLYAVQVTTSHVMSVNQLVNSLRAALSYLMRAGQVGLPEGVRVAAPGEVPGGKPN